MESLSTTISDLQNLILFLAPGFIFMLAFFYQIPDRKKSESTVIFISVLASLLINSITTGALQLINWFSRLKLHLPINGFIFWIITLFFSILFSILLVKFVKSPLFTFLSRKIFDVDTVPFGRVWNAFFAVRHITVLRIYLNDGTCYIGKLDAASIDPDDEVQEVTLLEPYYYEVKNGKPTVVRIKEVTSVLRKGDSIKSVEKINYDDAKQLYALPE